MEQIVLDLLLSTGINPRHKATRYLCALIESARTEQIFPLKRRGYPMVAKRFATTPECVDKAIQNAISAAWTKRMSEAFSNIVDDTRGKPTASKFIIEVAHILYGDRESF